MSDILKKIIVISSLLFFSLLILINFFVFFKGLMFLYIIPYIIFIPIIYILNMYISLDTKYFAFILFTLAFVSKAVVVFLFDTPPSSDFEWFYKAAIKASDGDFSFTNNGYFNVWAYQTGIVLHYAAIIKIFGIGLLPLKITNCLFMAGINTLIFLISRSMVNEKTSRFVSLIYLIYPAPYFLASVLTNQHISDFFLYAGVYLFMIKPLKPFLNIFIAAFLLALGNAMRPQGIAMIASFIIFGLLDPSTEKSIFKDRSFLSIILTAVLYFFIGQCFSQIIRVSGVNENGLKNMFPQYKLVVGLNYDTKGEYSTEDTETLMSISDKTARENKSIEIIKSRLSDPYKLLKLILYKQKIMWGDLDSTIGWSFNYLEKSGVNIIGKQISYSTFRTTAQKLEKSLYLLIFILAFIGIYSQLNKETYDKNVMLFTLLIMTNFAVYCFIEIQARYRDFAMIAMFIVAAKGFEFIRTRLLPAAGRTRTRFPHPLKFAHAGRVGTNKVQISIERIRTLFNRNR